MSRAVPVRSAVARPTRRARARSRARAGGRDDLASALDDLAVTTLRAIGELVGGADGGRTAPRRFPPGPVGDCALELAYDPLKFLERTRGGGGAPSG